MSAVAALTGVAACSDDGPGGKEPEVAAAKRYELSIRDSQDALSVSLDGISESVARVDSPFDWLDIAQGENDESGNTRINITRTAPTPPRFSVDSAYVYLADNRVVKMVIMSDAVISPSDENSADYSAFNKAWWEQEEILYSSTRTINGNIETVAQHIPLPWAPASTSNVPTRIFENDGLTSNVGWTMAYNLFSAQTNGNPNSKPYFALYNKYTGILRVFYYQFEDAGTGGELSFVITPGSATSPKYPYYHTMQYAFPVSNSELPLKGNVLQVTPGDNAFQQQLTPFVKADVTLKAGWYCFDLDWSAYNPTVAAFKPTDRLSIDCKTANNTSLTMAGIINGTSEGTIEGLSNTSTSSSNGVNYLDQFNSGTENATGALSALMEGNYAKAAFKGVMSLWNLCKAMTGNATDDYTSETKSTGTINQSFTGKISLDGYSTSNTSNNATGVEFAYSSFAQSSDAGRGVWSLQDNPTVYVVNDRLLGEDEDFSCVVDADCYLVGTEDPAPNNLRLMTFFDPTSIKFNLNTSLYPEIRNVAMSWAYGVYPNQPAGHTDAYRLGYLDFKNRGMLQEPEFIDKSKHKDKVYKSFSSDFANMTYMEFPMSEVEATSVDNTTKAKFYAQNDTLYAPYRYYGHAGNSRPETDKDFFIVDPVVFLPTECVTKKGETYGVGKFYDFVAPDFVVGVVLTFDYTLADGSKATAYFSKRFIPQVKAISTAAMLEKAKQFETYEKSGVHQTIGSVVIRHKDAARLLKQFKSTSKYIQTNK